MGRGDFRVTQLTRLTNGGGLMPGQSRRRWTNIKLTLDQCLVFAGIYLIMYLSRVLNGKLLYLNNILIRQTCILGLYNKPHILYSMHLF